MVLAAAATASRCRLAVAGPPRLAAGTSAWSGKCCKTQPRRAHRNRVATDPSEYLSVAGFKRRERGAAGADRIHNGGTSRGRWNGPRYRARVAPVDRRESVCTSRSSAGRSAGRNLSGERSDCGELARAGSGAVAQHLSASGPTGGSRMKRGSSFSHAFGPAFQAGRHRGGLCRSRCGAHGCWERHGPGIDELIAARTRILASGSTIREPTGSPSGLVCFVWVRRPEGLA